VRAGTLDLGHEERLRCGGECEHACDDASLGLEIPGQIFRKGNPTPKRKLLFVGFFLIKSEVQNRSSRHAAV